jgi:type VI secretion system FHA domain protein
MQTLMARSVTKRESRVEMTMIASNANNPLKFFPDADSALRQMLSQKAGGYMKPVRAFGNAFEDLQAHELAVMAGMRAALAAVLKRFDPQAIEQRLDVPTVMDKMMASSRKAKMWDRLVALYADISREADDDFQRLFGESFATAYEEQVDRMHSRGK